MSRTPPTAAQAESFYRAAFAAARFLDRESDHRVLDADADAAWRAYGSDLPLVVRCDLVLRNLAILYPAAFAPGPVFALSGWYDDDPWGSGFVRPAKVIVEAHFSARGAPADATEALERAGTAWGLAAVTDDARLASRLSPSTNLVVSGARAMALVARAFVRGERLSARTQIVLVSHDPASRHVLGVACAVLREAGVPLLSTPPSRAEGSSIAVWASAEKGRLGLAQARLFVRSRDAHADEAEAARALAAALGADETLEIADA